MTSCSDGGGLSRGADQARAVAGIPGTLVGNGPSACIGLGKEATAAHGCGLADHVEGQKWGGDRREGGASEEAASPWTPRKVSRRKCQDFFVDLMASSKAVQGGDATLSLFSLRPLSAWLCVLAPVRFLSIPFLDSMPIQAS